MEVSNKKNTDDSLYYNDENLRKSMKTIISLKLIQIFSEKNMLNNPLIKVERNERISERLNNSEKSYTSQKNSINLSVDLFDCGICFESFNQRDSTSFGCNHQFCYDCISDYLSTKITDGIIESFNCPYPECEAKASELIVEQFVPLPIYERYLKLQIQRGVSHMDDVFYCPNTECHAIIECEVDVGIGSCHKCGHIFCTSCLQEYHGTSDCYLNEHQKLEMLLRYQIQKRAEDEEIARQLSIAEEKRKASEEEKQRRIEQDRASESLIKIAYKKCPGCRSDVEKLNGCNRMFCTNCKNNFCWLCLQLLRGDPYQHFGAKCQVHT